MAIVRPFKGIRPENHLADKVASLPYDVMNVSEAREMAKDNEYSFLHVVRSEIDFDSIGQYDEEVYLKARSNLDMMIDEGIFIQDDTPKFYIYRQIMKGRAQTGIVGCTSIDDYMNNTIKKHELTRQEKEKDRINHFNYCDANTAPIFLTYRYNEELNVIVNNWVNDNSPVYNFESEDGITHLVWIVEDDNTITKIEEIFAAIDYLYIADGHHRSASAVKVGQMRRDTNPDYNGREEYNYFLSVIFPDEDLFIMDYNRVVKDLNGLTEDEFLLKVSESFIVREYDKEGQYKPTEKHTYGMYLNNKWYILKAKDGIFNEDDPVERLDVSILQNNLLEPILGIEDPRTDKRIDFVGGLRGLEELERRIANDMKVAFSMYPTTMEDLLSIADAGEIMPPKSTWFEPKLRSGLFVHKLS